jgi:hypothetical protein
MSKKGKISFVAIIEQHPGMNAGYISFPYDVEKLYRVKVQVKVKALFDGAVEYRGSLVKMGTPRHILIITKDVRYLLGKTFGDEIHVEIQKDTEPREVILPDDVSAILQANPKAGNFFESLSFTDKKEFIRWIDMTKNPETRERRKKIFLEKLLENKKLFEK